MLRRVIVLVIFACLKITPSAYADNIPVVNGVAQDHFVWPKEAFPIDWSKFVVVKVDLPYLSLDDAHKPAVRDVYYVDLNEDGEREMIVCLGRDGITTDFAVFQRHADKWNDIGAIIGLGKICAMANGYYQLESDRDYRGGSTGRNLYRFIKGQYRLIRSEEYERGTLTAVAYDPAGIADEEVIYDKE